MKRFEGKSLGEIHGQVFLGMIHERDWDKGIIYLSEPRHIDTVLSEHGLSVGRPVSTPLDHKVVLLPTTEHDKQVHPQLGRFAAIVGSIMYLSLIHI